MKRTIRVFSVILGVLAAGTFTAVADDDEKKEKKPRAEREGRGDRDGEGRRGRRGPRQVPKEILEKYDKNKNGKLDEDEMKAAREARRAEFIKKFDKDGDGKLSEDEQKAARAEFQKRRGERGGGDRPRGERGGDRPKRGEGRPGGRHGGKKDKE